MGIHFGSLFGGALRSISLLCGAVVAGLLGSGGAGGERTRVDRSSTPLGGGGGAGEQSLSPTPLGGGWVISGRGGCGGERSLSSTPLGGGWVISGRGGGGGVDETSVRGGSFFDGGG